MSEIYPVSPPQPASNAGSYKCYVEKDNELYEAVWEDTRAYPNFNYTPLYQVNLSVEVAAVWSKSRSLDFGSGAFVRSFDEGAFPVVKIAHPNWTSRLQIQREFEFVRKMAGFDGIFKVSPEPLIDAGGIFGFRSERLSKIDLDKVKAKGHDVHKIVERLHAEGYCHGDLNPSNVMLNEEGNVVLIDFAFSGIIGQPIGTHVPRWAYGTETYEKEVDDQALERYFGEKSLAGKQLAGA